MVQACQRHWTDGGTLRKVETGAGKRNSRRQRGNGATSDSAVPAHHKFARVGEKPHQNWQHENMLQQQQPMLPGCAPFLDAGIPDHHSSEANASFHEGSSFNAEKVSFPLICASEPLLPSCEFLSMLSSWFHHHEDWHQIALTQGRRCRCCWRTWTQLRRWLIWMSFLPTTA